MHREIEKVQGWGCQGKVERTEPGKQAQGKGVFSQLEVRENTEQRGSQVDLSLEDHSITALGLD